MKSGPSMERRNDEVGTKKKQSISRMVATGQKLPSLTKMSPVKSPQVQLAAYKRCIENINAQRYLKMW